jgi:hypothetical protein
MTPLNNKRIQQKLGWIGLGVCLDYFIFRPIRLLRPLFTVALGFGISIFFIKTVERMVVFAKYLLGL